MTQIQRRNPSRNSTLAPFFGRSPFEREERVSQRAATRLAMRFGLPFETAKTIAELARLGPRGER
jgi:hypothetical protein